MPTYGHYRGPDSQAWQAGCGPRAASWTTLQLEMYALGLSKFVGL